MARDLISRTTRREFREYLVGLYLREIADIFDDVGLERDESYSANESGQRRSLVEQYYHSVDWTNPKQVRLVLNAYENILINMPLESRARYEQFLLKDGYRFDGARVVPTQDPLASEDQLEKIAEELDIDVVNDQMARLRRAIIDDPALAIGTAKELLESICKGIIHNCGQDLAGNEDLPALVKLSMKSLRMSREDIPDDKKGAQARKHIASGLASACNGIAELRNIYGTGHGQGPDAEKALDRDANLAVGTATTLGRFLAEVFLAQERRKKRAEE